jgi:hypothetical protein
MSFQPILHHVRSIAEEDRIVLVISSSEVAFQAEECAHLFRLVTVIDAKRALELPLADQARSALPCQTFVVVLKRHPVSLLEVGLALGAASAGQLVCSVFGVRRISVSVPGIVLLPLRVL